MARSVERMAAIKERLAAGMSADEIAKDLGIGRSTVYRFKNRSGARLGDRAAYKTIAMKVTDRELLHLDRLVKQGLAPTRSAVLRKMVRAMGGFYDPSQEERAFLEKAERDLSGLTTNFNQIAMALNTSVKKMGHASPTPEQIERVREANDEVYKIQYVIGMMLRNMQTNTQGLTDRLAADPYLDDDE